MAFAPSPVLEHCLNHPKGWFNEAALDFAAKLSGNVTFSPVYGGRVVHVNSAGEFEMGIGDTDMAIFLLNADTDFDVNNPTFTSSGRFIQQSIAPNGVMSGLVATGGYELESSEFDASRTYVNGQVLTATASNSSATTGGRLTNNCVQYNDPVCGVVSRGKFTNEHNVAMLAFWPVYLPAGA